jgi:hypothetical protein
MATQIGIAIRPQEILEEVNRLQDHFREQLINKTDDGKERLVLIQLLAIGVLFTKWMQANPEDHRSTYSKIITDVAAALTGP